MAVSTRVLSTCIRAMIVLCACFMLSVSVLAGTYWVSPTGIAAWASCNGSTPLSGTAACSLATANTNASAGDTVYFRGGTYTFDSALNPALAPSHSGTCASTCLGGVGANRITFAAYAGETPVLQQANTSNIMIGLYLHGISWVKVTGISFKNFMEYPALLDNGSSYNEISYNSFTNDPAFQVGTWFSIGGTAAPWSTHNWVHHNYLSSVHAADPCGQAVDLLRIGNAESSPYSIDDYNTVESNYMEYAGHSIVLVESKHDVLKNNIAHNEPWISGCVGSLMIPTYDNPAYNGLYGHRVFGVGDEDAQATDNAFVLVEGNRLGFGGVNPGNAGSNNLDLAVPGNIARYNFVYGSQDSGIYFKWGNSFGAGTGGVNNHVFNNTIYGNGHGWNAGLYGHDNLSYNGEGVAQYTGNGSNTNNVVKNNIVYGNGYSGQWDICALGWYPGSNCSAAPWDTVTNNWLTSNGDPKFTNPALTDPLSQNLFVSVHGYAATPIPDLSLQSSSPAIDGGTWLTTASGTGTNSTSLVVADAWYFQDGTLGSDLARGVTFFPDRIAIGTVGNTVQISSINYGTNTITLTSPMTWANAAHVWLYKKSDGAVVLNGSAPDYGASEFGVTTGGTASTPTGLQAVAH